jgi:dTDP-4-amino-4,6-dideoxygalactose transaminase
MNIPSLKISFPETERKWILDNIDECLSSGFLSQGKHVRHLEEKVASVVGSKYAIAVNSGTSAIELVMRIFDVKGKEILVPTNTFLATATGALFAGGSVKLVDISPETLSIDLNQIKKSVTKNTVGVIIVHIGGIITHEINEIRHWCEKQGYWLFEDAAHAMGSSLDGHYAGTFGAAGSFSLFATKVITSGEGGIILTDDDNIAREVRLLRNHGKPEEWVTYHTAIGSNYRMSDITAIIALSQLNRLQEIISKRDHLARQYTELLEEYIPLLKPVHPPNRSNWYKYIVLLPKSMNRARIKQQMKERGIGLQGEVYAVPLHRQPVLEHLAVESTFPNADDICGRHICLPIYPGLTGDQIKHIVIQLAEVIKMEEILCKKRLF